MGEFDEFAKKLGAEHAAKSEQYQAAEQQKRQEWIAQGEAAKANLERDVLPLLRDAAAACKDNGWRTEVDEGWRSGLLSSSPAVEFQVFGDKQRAHGGGTYEVHGHRIAITHDGADFTSRVTRNALWVERNKEYQSRGIDGAKEAIKIAMESLCEALSPDTR